MELEKSIEMIEMEVSMLSESKGGALAGRSR